MVKSGWYVSYGNAFLLTQGDLTLSGCDWHHFGGQRARELFYILVFRREPYSARSGNTV